MRFKYLRYLAFALGGLSTVVASGALYLKVSFDGPRLAAELTHFAKQRYQRTLRFEGPPQLAMFPRLELRLPGATLSGRNGDGEFLGVEHAAVGVRLIPLLAGRVVVDRIDADGLRVALWRGKDGKLNAADLFAAPPADTPVDFDVDRLGIVRGALNWIDDTSGRHFALSDIALDTDRELWTRGQPVVVRMRVTNTLPDERACKGDVSRGNGIALANVRARLSLLHDVQADFSAGVQDGLYQVRLSLPAPLNVQQAATPSRPSRKKRHEHPGRR